ncbi:dynein heavy chain, putative [Plasmodium malariae]|uniref:Dynein heavy chain, putative n=2 Tax=Plasmodium malariae TaxID=5858 RepID=A0A1D3TCE2_PLAMA|nr:dynein heavy chain, putative [Plasmodium malariae]SCP02479.1 dynein heavy chain, putative [Plasmodium malariae]
MNNEFEHFVKQKIVSLLRIEDDVFNCYMQDGRNKDDLNYFFLSSPINTTLFLVLYKLTYEDEINKQPLCKNEESTKKVREKKLEEKDECSQKKEDENNNHPSDNSANKTQKESGKKDDVANTAKKKDNDLLKSDENDKKNEKDKENIDKTAESDEIKKGEGTRISNEVANTKDDEENNGEDVTSKINGDCEQTENIEEKKNTHYVLKMSIGNISIDETEEEHTALVDRGEEKEIKKKKKRVQTNIVYFLKIKEDKIHENMDEYFNNNYIYGNLHHNYINNFKAYFKVFFIPFFQCLLKKNKVFECIGKDVDQNVKIEHVLNKLKNFKKNEMLNDQSGEVIKLNENKYLNIMERGKYAHQQKEFAEENYIDKVREKKNLVETFDEKENKLNTSDYLSNNKDKCTNYSISRSTEKEENYLRNKNLLNSFYYILSYYKQILKVEQISYNEINTDIMKLKDDTININNYLRNISNIIKNFIIKEKKNDVKKKYDKTSVEYWKERHHRVYNLLEKINSKKFEQIIENIKGKIYNNELSNEIKMLLKEIENMHMESFEMIKFSKLLENSFDTLKHVHINQMKNGIKLVIRKLKNIWLSSKYFRKDEIIIAFFLKLSEILFEFILFLAIKIKKINKPKRIKKVISKCIDILKFYEKEFIYVKLDIETIDIRKNWYFDKNIIFKNIRHLQHVLATLYTVYSEIIYFTDLCLLKLKKLVNNKKITNNIILEINELYEPFNDVLKNIYLYDDESIMQLMKKLNEQCLKIEKKCIKIIHIQFSNLRNTKATYLLVEKFQNLKKSYKIDRLLIKKLYDILFLYKKELYLYIDLFNNMCTNKDLDIYKKFLFCLNIYKKIKKPMLIFKNNSYITTSNEYKIIVKLYINFCKKMFTYIVETYVIWKNNSLSQMNKFLSSNIITINKQLNFYYIINFDNNFFKTLYEYAYMESTYDFNTPIEILNMYNLKKKLYRYLYELNEIILFFKNFTTNTSIIEQKVLIKFFQCFEQKLIYISNNINWLNLNIDHYIKDLKNCKNTIENVHLSLSYSLNSIDNIIFNMQNINVVRYIEWGNMKPLHIQPFFNYFEEYRIKEVNKILEKYKEISQILIKIEQIVEKTKNGRSEIMDELYYLYQCKIYKCLSLIIIKGLCNYETLIENDFQKKFLDNYKPCLYIKEDIYSDVFLNNSIQNIFKLISKLLTNLLLSSSEFIRWLDYSCIEVPISLKEDFEFFKMKFSFYQSVSKNKIIIDRIIHIHQLIQNVFQKANKYIYSFLNYDNIISSIIKAQSSFNIHQNITYPLIYYDNILKNITNIQNKIDKENDKKTIQFISLNISFVLNSIKSKLLDSKKFFFNNLHFIFTTLKCSTLSEITKYRGILKTCTNSMDNYENIIKTINTIKAENINIEINIQKTEEIYNMITIYDYNIIKDEQKTNLFSLYPMYLNMLNSAFFNDNLMFTIKQEFYRNTKNKIIVFEEKVKRILKKFHLIGPSSENINLSEGIESLKKYINDFKTLEIEKEEIIKAQILCNMKIFLFENFYLLKNTIKIYNSIYSIYNSYTTRINDFLDVIYYKLNIKEINKSLKVVKSELIELQKEQPEANNILAFKKINEELNKMNTTLTIVYLLQNTNMKLTNWHEIINLHLRRNNIKDPITFENNIIINDKSINIKSITLYDMYELKIYLHFNDIKYIIYKIKEVEKLEKCINKIENKWKQETLKIIKYNDCFILDDNRSIFKNIKKTFNDLHLMRNLNFAQDLIPKINYLQSKLLFVHELLSLWALTQEKWASLQSFYNNENFNHFSNELKNFNKINKTYIEIMKNVKKNPNLFHSCSTQFFYFLKNYYDRVLFLFDETIIEVVTTKNNTFNLKNGVKIIGIDTYIILKEKIKSTLKENVITSLKMIYNTNIIIPIIVNNISVVSSLVIKVLLSEEIKNIIQQKNAEYTQKVLNKYSDLCNNIIQEIKKEKGKNIQKIEQSLIIYLNFIGILQKIIQENLFDENSFFLYYQFGYTLDKNKEQVLVKYGNYAFKYNYDILENNNLFINLLPNDKYVFSICSNIHKSYYNIISGNNKTSTILYITSALGRRTHFIERKINNIKNYILGSIQLGLKKKEKNIYIFNKDVPFNSNSVIFFTSKCYRCTSIPSNLRGLCKETIINNCREVELVEILLHINDFSNAQILCRKFWNFMEYINFIYFKSENNMLNDVISIINLCKEGNAECDKDLLLAKYTFIHYYGKLKDITQCKLQGLIKKFLDVDLSMKFYLDNKRDLLKELVQQERIYLKDHMLSDYEKEIYLLKEKLQNQFVSVVFGGAHIGKSTLLKIYNTLYNSKYSFIYFDALYDPHGNFNENFLHEMIKKKQEKYKEYTFIMKINYLNHVIYDFLSLNNLFYSKDQKMEGSPANRLKIIIECNDMSLLDPYLLNKMNKIFIKDNINMYIYFKNKTSKLIDSILNTNFFFEKNIQNNKTSSFINNYEEKKKILLELYSELKLFYRNFFLPIFNYIEKKKGNNFNINNYYTKVDDIKNMTLNDNDFTQKDLFHVNVDEKILINNFLDIFKNNIFIFLKEAELDDQSSLSKCISTKSNIKDAINLQIIEELHRKEYFKKKETSINEDKNEKYRTNEEYNLDNIDKSYIDNVCILQAEKENNKKVDLYSKKEICKILTIKNKYIFILISCLIFLFNNFLNDHEKCGFFIFLKKLIASNKINLDNNLENYYYHIHKNKWVPICEFFNSTENDHFDEKYLLYHDEEMKKKINSISLLYKGQSNICLIGDRKNCKTAIFKEIIDRNKNIDHVVIDVLKYINVLNFKVLHDKLIKKNVKKYFHQSILYICIDDIHVNYEKSNNPSVEFLHNLQRNLCYCENKIINIENIKSIITLELEQMKKNSYYKFISYYYSFFFLNSSRKCLLHYFNSLINHSLDGKFQGIHNKLVSYTIDLFWKIHEDINLEEKKENSLLFTKENIFLFYEEFFCTKWNFENEQDVVINWCENAESMILNRILKKESKKEVMKMIKNAQEKHFNIINENNSTYLNYFSKDVYEKIDNDVLKDEFLRSLSSYNNLYINTKMFVEFYFKNILEVYKKISKNVNSSMIICINKKKAIILLNAVAFILNINSVIINKSNIQENVQEKINYYNRLRFKRNLFILINYSKKYDDYFYSLIYKKFPSALFDKKELFQMYTKTNLISNELKWENIQNIMKNNTYVCLVHEKRFDLSMSNFQNYKNIYNDIYVIHIDCWYKEEYIRYCRLFLKNYSDNHFVDNILNNFKKKVILNTLEDDIEKQNKNLAIEKKEKDKEDHIFINSLDYIKKNKNEQPEAKESETKNRQEKEIDKEKDNTDENETTQVRTNEDEKQKQNNNLTEKKKDNYNIKNNEKKEKKENNIQNKNDQQNEERKNKGKLKLTSQEKEKKTEKSSSIIKIIKKGVINKDSKIEKNNIVSSKNTTDPYSNKENSKKKEIINSIGNVKTKKNENITMKEVAKSNEKETREGELNKSGNKSDHNKNTGKMEKKHNKRENSERNVLRTNKPTKGDLEHKKKQDKKDNRNIISNNNSNKNKIHSNYNNVNYEAKEELVVISEDDQRKAEVDIDKYHEMGKDEKKTLQEKEGTKGKGNGEMEGEKEGEIEGESKGEREGEKVDGNNDIHTNGTELSKEGESKTDDENAKNKDYNYLKSCNKRAINEFSINNAEMSKYNFYSMIEKQLENVVDVFIEVYYDLKNFLKRRNSNLDFIRINKSNFVDSLVMFYILLKNKLNYKNKQLQMFRMGLKKVESIFKNYNNMNTEIEQINTSICSKEDTIVNLNEAIKNDSKLLVDMEQQFNSNKQILNEVVNDIDEMMEHKNESEKQIEEECISIIFKIQNVENSEIKNILKITNPDMTLISISIILNTLVRNSFLNDNNDNWNYFKSFISKENFSKFFFNFKKENVTDKQIKRIKDYISKDEIARNTKKIYEMNNLFTYFFEWVNFILKYKEYYKNTCQINESISSNTLKKEKFEKENQMLLEQMHNIKSSIVSNKSDVNKQMEQLEDLNKKLNIINKSYLPILEIKEFLEKIQKKYTITIEQIENNYKYLVSEILLFSFFLNYSSSFNYKYRCFLLDKWKRIIKKNNILIKDDVKIENIYSCDSIISLFISDNFPRHIFYIQNALISLNHFRWPLLLDQQNIGIEWLKKSYSNNLVIHNFDENLSKHLDMCIIYGKSLIVPFFNFQNLYIYEKKNNEEFNCDHCNDQDNVKTIQAHVLCKKNFLKFKLKYKEIKLNSNYSIIEPVIERNVYLINGKYYINIGKKKLEYNKHFRLFLVSDSNDRYFEDIEDYVNIIDFQIDKKLIVNKIVNIILKHEDEKKLINFNTKIRNFYETKQTLKFLDDGMIIELCTFDNKINNNKNLMSAINNNVLKKIEIKKMLNEYKHEINKIKSSSENIKCLGYRFHSIYKVLLKQSRVKSVYSFNFNYLLNILNNLIKNINKKILICNFNQLIKKFTHNCFVFLLNTINQKDKLFFCFLFYSSLLFEEKKLINIKKSIKIEKEKYYSLFLKMRNLTNNDTTDLHKVEWLSEKKKRELLFLQNELENFKLLIEDLKNNSIEYFNWYKQVRPEEHLSFLKRIQLDKLEIILFIYVMRKDRLYYYIYFLLTNYLDLTENVNFSFNPSKDLNYIDAKIFLHITKEGNNFYESILSKHNNAIKTLSVGNNFNSDTQIIMETSLQNGKKLLLENIHLIKYNIDKFYEIYNNKKIHSNFELYLTSEQDTSISILKKAIKIFPHKDEYLKTLLTELFAHVQNIYKDKLRNNFVNSFLFSLSFFHTILVCRSNYDNFGFDELYHFDIKDFESTFDCLLHYFDLVQVNSSIDNELNNASNMVSKIGSSRYKNMCLHFNTSTTSKEAVTKEMNINWAFVKEIILNGYGNKVNYADRKIIKSYIKEYFNEYSFNEKNEFIYSIDENYNYKFLLNGSIKEYTNLIKGYPFFNSCKTYGMKIEADKKKHEKYNESLIKNLEKICSKEILIYKKDNNDDDVFFNLESDYYSSSNFNSDEDEKKEKEIKEEILYGVAHVEKQDEYTKDLTYEEERNKKDDAYDNGSNCSNDYGSDFFVNINKKGDMLTGEDRKKHNSYCHSDYYLKLDFLKNVKKMNIFYELIKKLKLTFKHNISINSEWTKSNITTVQSCCINETKKFKEITNMIYCDVIKIENELNKNKKYLDIDTKLNMIYLSLNKVPKKWTFSFNKKIKTVHNFITYYENIKEQLYFWNITGELTFYNMQYLFNPFEFFKALLIKFCSVHKKNLKDCIFTSKINNSTEINKKENPHSQKNFFYSSDEEDHFITNDINYADYVHYDTENYCDVYLLGIYTLNNNFECLGIKSTSKKKYDKIPIITLSIIEKKEKNILKDRKIPLYQYKYNGKLKKKNNKFITNMYFKSDKHKSFIYISKVYLFIYN